jgi:hypothetical protein
VLGLLYDTHGNLPALEAVLEDCPADRFLLGGDYASFGAWPVETVERLRELDAEWIRGNVDRWLVDAQDAPGVMVPLIERSREMVGEDLCRELAVATRIDDPRGHALLPRLAAVGHGQLLSRAAGQ